MYLCLCTCLQVKLLGMDSAVTHYITGGYVCMCVCVCACMHAGNIVLRLYIYIYISTLWWSQCIHGEMIYKTPAKYTHTDNCFLFTIICLLQEYPVFYYQKQNFLFFLKAYCTPPPPYSAFPYVIFFFLKLVLLCTM